MDSLPRREARGGVLVDADSVTREIDGGAGSGRRRRL